MTTVREAYTKLYGQIPDDAICVMIKDVGINDVPRSFEPALITNEGFIVLNKIGQWNKGIWKHLPLGMSLAEPSGLSGDLSNYSASILRGFFGAEYDLSIQ